MCGQCAYIGPSQGYDYTLFKLLSLMQDKYGRDNAGFAHMSSKGKITRQVCSPKQDSLVFDLVAYEQDHIIGASLYELLCLNVDLPRSVGDKEDSGVIISHSRKGSVGADDIEYAQPVLVEAADYELILTHNGTIYNYEEVGKELNFLVEPTNDSHAIGIAITEGKEKEFFEKVEGTATCMWVKSNLPNQLFCVGLQRDRKAKDENPTATRPLHFIELYGGVYLSRERDPLSHLSALVTTPSNYKDMPRIYKLAGNVIACFTVEDGATSLSTIGQLKRAPIHKPRNKKIGFADSSTIGTSTSDEVVLLSNDVLPKKRSNRITFAKGLYFDSQGDVICTPYRIDSNGIIHIEKTYYVTPHSKLVYKASDSKDYYFHATCKRYHGNVDDLTPAYFLDGVLMLNKESFLNIISSFPFQTWRPVDLASYSLQPVWTGCMSNMLNVTKNTLYWYPPSAIEMNPQSSTLVNGEFVPLFSNKKYIFKHGVVKDIQIISYKEAAEHWVEFEARVHLLLNGIGVDVAKGFQSRKLRIGEYYKLMDKAPNNNKLLRKLKQVTIWCEY